MGVRKVLVLLQLLMIPWLYRQFRQPDLSCIEDGITPSGGGVTKPSFGWGRAILVHNFDP